MQAALFLREKQELRKKKLKIRRELPSHVATRDIAPFPRFPPNSWFSQGKAAWQDRELAQHELERRDSIALASEAASTHRCKQKEAHRRWVKRNRIHDSSFGDCSSEDEELYGIYGVQSAAANALLYIGLGTMCVGMIIAFVGTGEKGFKTMELRLIGPSLIGAGVMIIILRVMLCVCPSKCLRLNKHKHKHKNSTNKLNSEGREMLNSTARDQPAEELVLADRTSLIKTEENNKKRVSIVTMPTTSGVGKSTNFKKSSSDIINNTSGETPTYPVSIAISPDLSSNVAATISFLEHERGRPSTSKSVVKIPNLISTSDEEEVESKRDMDLSPLDEISIDTSSFESATSNKGKTTTSEGGGDDDDDGRTTLAASSPQYSDVSLTSLTNGIINSDSVDSELSVKTVKTSTNKFEAHRSPKNVTNTSELVLSPSNLEEMCDNDN